MSRMFNDVIEQGYPLSAMQFFGRGLPSGPNGPFSVSVPADITALITALGGPSVVVSFFDCRYGVTAPSNNVSSWATCSGTITAPFTSQGTGTAPTITAPGSNITFATSQKFMGTATGAYPLHGPCTIFMVSSCAVSSAQSGLGGIDSTTEEIQIDTNATPVYGASMGTTVGDLLVSTVAPSATIRAMAVKLSGANGTGTLVISNGTPVTGAATTAAGTSISLFLGTNNGSGTTIAMVHAAFVILNFVTSSGQDTTMYNWAVTNHAAV